jgi:hypothetical protein
MAILIYLITPALGVAAFLLLRARLVRQGLDTYWQALLFALFFAYGGLLEILLTMALWEWAGMAERASAQRAPVRRLPVEHADG